MTRSEILKQADAIVNGERQQAYGSAENSFALISALWADYLGIRLSAVDVALMMILLKVAREKGGQGKADNWIDIAGYAACGGEIATIVEDEAEDIETVRDECYKRLVRAIFNSAEADGDGG